MFINVIFAILFGWWAFDAYERMQEFESSDEELTREEIANGIVAFISFYINTIFATLNVLVILAGGILR